MRMAGKGDMNRTRAFRKFRRNTDLWRTETRALARALRSTVLQSSAEGQAELVKELEFDLEEFCEQAISGPFDKPYRSKCIKIHGLMAWEAPSDE